MLTRNRPLDAAALVLAVVSLLAPQLAAAQDVPEPSPRFARYMPLYPGQYGDLAVQRDTRDSSFDAAGNERDSAVPTLPGQTKFPRTDVVAGLTWHLPLFEDYDIPFISSTTHLLRVQLRYADTRTEGPLAAFIADDSDDASTNADDLRNEGSGIGDVTVEGGSFLYGADNWRTRQGSPLAVLFKAGLRINFGSYDRDAPTSAGTNTPEFHAVLGVHAQPWKGSFVDVGVGRRAYLKNQDPAFGGLAPTQQGDDTWFDVSLAQQLGRRFFLTAFYYDRSGDSNQYTPVLFAPNPPEPPPNSDNFPSTGIYSDGGTELQTMGLALDVFAGQRWQLGLQWTHPTAGRSGQFDLPYTNRTPPGCTVGATGCMTSDGETVFVDAYGPARVFATDRFTVSARFQFGEGDTFTCVGCERR